jgi:enoyl-CoA hydratase/carnithine racemase
MVSQMAEHLANMAVDNAVSGIIITGNGLSIDDGGTYTLPRFMGHARALEIAAFDLPISEKQVLEWGRDGLCDCAESSDGQEGVNAFIEKRKPTYYFIKKIRNA